MFKLYYLNDKNKWTQIGSYRGMKGVEEPSKITIINKYPKVQRNLTFTIEITKE